MESSVAPTTRDGAPVGAAASAEQLLSLRQARHGTRSAPGPRERSVPGSTGWTTRFSYLCSSLCSRGPALVLTDLERTTW